ncbi:MAG: glycosyl transferase [Acidimicrobiaceae bacterium]|nr:glycosyl transferase [Acidimicrobiaceae bacterium]
MGDFFQNGVITTFHDLSNRTVGELESDISDWAKTRPISLLIPALYSEFEGPAIPKIVSELRKVTYLDEIIVGLDNADYKEFEKAKKAFQGVDARCRIIWNDGPAMREIQKDLAQHNLGPLERGKGANVWYAMGYFLASGRGSVLGMHDADIVTYSRDMLAKLIYPVANPTFGYVFSKGFYFRADEQGFNGRVSRLLVTPLIRALQQTLGSDHYLSYLDSFRYPLAGECAMNADVVMGLRIPFDWGLEVGVLSEVYRRYTSGRVCQVDLAGVYDHKHQHISENDSSQGLHRMATDITKSMYRKLAIRGQVFSKGVFRTLKATYYRTALDFVDHFTHDAEMNGFPVDRHKEEQLVEMFAQTITAAGEQYLSRPMELPLIPSWAVTLDAQPDVFNNIQRAVEIDNA